MLNLTLINRIYMENSPLFSVVAKQGGGFMARFVFKNFPKTSFLEFLEQLNFLFFCFFFLFHSGSEPNVYYRLQSSHESKTSTAADYQYESYYECRNALILFAKMIYVPHGSG